MEAWTQFFVRSGIPINIASKYAKSFETNRITKEMLPDLDKSTLAELGVTAIGDQILILKRINSVKNALISKSEDDEEMLESSKSQRVRITAPGENFASNSRKGKPPPDRHEIYHVKMPSGNTLRTQKILQKAEIMRKQGLAVRGTTGVRQGGRAVSPIDKTSLAARLTKRDSEVSSSTDANRFQKFTNNQTISTKINKISGSKIQKSIHNRIVYSKSSNITQNSSDVRLMQNRLSRKKNFEINKSNKKINKIMVEDLEEEDDDDINGTLTVRYSDEMEEYEDDNDFQPTTSSVHSRLSYIKPSYSTNRPSSKRNVSIIDQSDSVFSRVTYY